MKTTNCYIHPKQLDSYSMLIVSKYLTSIQDFINTVCVNTKFKETTEKLRFNPIPITSKKLFPKMQTQYLYDENDIKIDGIENYEIWYDVTYEQYLNYNNKCHHVKYSSFDMKQYGMLIPNGVNILDNFKYSGINFISIPNHINSISDFCFMYCGALKSVELADGLKIFPDSCFSYCTSLTSIIFPTTTQSIGNDCLNGCCKLVNVTIPNSVTLIGDSCFNYCELITSITIPSTLRILNNYVFNCCYSLMDIKLPATLTSIGDNCFGNCSSLTTIKLPSSLIHIGNCCFSNCGLKFINIPKSVKQIGTECFQHCSTLTSLNMESMNKQFTSKVSYKDHIFYKQFNIQCTNIKLTDNDVNDQFNEIPEQQDIINTYNIPFGIVKINAWVFHGQNLKNIIIPTTVTSIGSNCFESCWSLESLLIPKSVKSIGINCFSECHKLKQLSLPLNEMKKYPFKASYGDYLILKQCKIECSNVIIDDYSFYSSYDQLISTNISVIMSINQNTKETIIPDHVISLKYNHLSRQITTISIPTSVTYLCDKCFKNYVKLQSITIPITVKSIGKHLIDGCIKLTELNYEGDWNNIIVSYKDHLIYKSKGLILNNIEYTKKDKMKYGNVIPSIVHSLNKTFYVNPTETFYIPNYITSIDNHMFATFKWSFISHIHSIVIPTSITTIPKHCFSKCYLLTNVSLPKTITIIKKKAFYNCISLQTINIPTSIIEIEKRAFYNCYSLTLVTLLTTVSIGDECFTKC